MTDHRIKNIVIVGGGTAGWMVASALSRFLRSGYTKIRLIESEEIGTVGVGEATIPPIRSFLAMLRIDERDFIRRTQGTYKLGIEFVDWARPGHRYMHPFGQYGADIEGVPFHQYWLRQHSLGKAPDIDEFSLTTVAAREGRFGAVSGRGFPQNHWAYAYQFDASLVAAYLREYAERTGVQRTEGRVVDVSLHPESGHLERLLLQSGEQGEGDFFIDCSGFSALLIEKTMQVKVQDWSQWLPCDRAVAVPSQNTAPPKPFTRSTAMPAGWQWRIPLQHRTGNGYVYTSQAISDDQAAATLLANLEGEALAEPRFIPFQTGRRKTFWTKNCLAMGLAAGFLEPLESTAIHLVQQGIARLLALFPDKNFSAIEIDEYNRQMGATYEQVRDFLILHYKLTAREDSGLWLYCRDMAIPESLQHKMDLFAGKGRCFRYDDDLFSVTSWVAVMLGQGIQPTGYDEVVNSMSEQELDDVLNRMLEGIRTNVRKMPAQQDFLNFRTRPAR